MRQVDVLIDGDPLVYRIGFSLQSHIYYLQWRDVDPEHMDEPGHDTYRTAMFYNAAARDRYINLQGLHKDEWGSVMDAVPIGDESIVFGRVKQTLRDIENRVGAYLYEHDSQIGTVRVFLSGTENFRNQVATITKYKGSRDKTTRPYWYSAIREYLIMHWGAEVSDGIEADDTVSILQWQAEQGDTIICTIDKDLLNVPGHHYNYMKKEARFVSYKDAMLRFYRQILTGDSTDDIPGCKKIGPVAAAKILPEWKPESTMYIAVLRAYVANVTVYPEHHGPYGDSTTSPVDGARASLLENARLVFMLTKEDELWSPPGVENQSIKRFLAAPTPEEFKESL